METSTVDGCNDSLALARMTMRFALQFYRDRQRSTVCSEYSGEELSLPTFIPDIMEALAGDKDFQTYTLERLALLENAELDKFKHFAMKEYELTVEGYCLLAWMCRLCMVSAAAFERGFVDIPSITINILYEKGRHRIKESAERLQKVVDEYLSDWTQKTASNSEDLSIKMPMF